VITIRLVGWSMWSQAASALDIRWAAALGGGHASRVWQEWPSRGSPPFGRR
jgi:hypothetical protein